MNSTVITSALSDVAIIYRDYNHASQVIAELTPADYFLACEVLSALQAYKISQQEGENLSFTENDDSWQCIFHLTMAVNKACLNGNTCLPLKRIANTRYGFASDEQGNVSHQGFQFPPYQALQSIIEQLQITADDNQLILVFNDALYLRRYFLLEQALKAQIQSRIAVDQMLNNEQIKAVIDELFTDNHDEVDWQKIAVANAINKNFTVIAGGPGTGKTYTVTKLLAALVMLNQQNSHNNTNAEKNYAEKQTEAQHTEKKYALIAPTGKAAQRLSESIKNSVNQFSGQIASEVLEKIPTDAQTIHRLLGYIPNQIHFKFNENNLLSLDFVLIDEASMVDLALLTRLLRALPSHCKVVLLGDADQLPSVALGSVLADIAPRPHPGVSLENQQYLAQVTGSKLNKAKKQPVDYLTFLLKSRRFDGEGGIGKLAKSVIVSDVQASWQLLKQAKNQKVGDLSLVELASSEQSLRQLLTPYIEQYYAPLFKAETPEEAFELLTRFRILAATRVGAAGIEALNNLCQNVLEDKGLVPKYQEQYHAMPIIINENNHRLGVYNGDVGLLWTDESGHLMALFEQLPEQTNNFQPFKKIIPSRLPAFEPVYAMTIHKTQGSEFNHVLMTTPENSDNRLLSRELLYTGITRAKQQLTIFTNENVWRQGVDIAVKRDSNLSI